MTQFNTPTYDLQRATGKCAMTGRPLEPGEKYFATLVEVGGEDASGAEPDSPIVQSDGEKAAEGKPDAATALGFQRIDVSQEAWDHGERPGRIFCHWLTTVPQPNQKRKVFVDDEVLLNLIRRLADDQRPQRVAFRFVIALILMRKKLLRYDGTDTRPPPEVSPEASPEVSPESNAETESETPPQQWWKMTPKLDLSKGQFGKWSDKETLEILDPKLDDERILQVTEQLGEILEAEL